MMNSRFYQGGSSSDEESEDDNLSKNESEGEEEDGSESSDDGAIKVPSKFAQGGSDSEDEKQQKPRVVKSVKDRKYDELNETVKRLTTAVRANDWNTISSDFDKLNKQITAPKLVELIKKDGKGTPKVYLKALVLIEDQVAEVDTKKPKMNPTNTRNFKSMKQTIKKHNKSYEKELEEYRKNPGQEDEGRAGSDDDSMGSESEEEIKKPVVKKTNVPTKPANKWMKQQSDSESDDEDGSGSGEDWNTVPTRGQARVQKPQKAEKAEPAKPVEPEKPKELSPEEVRAKIKEILLLRGKRGTDPAKQEEKLRELLPFARDSDLHLDVLMNIISFQFDTSRSAATHLPLDKWKAVLANLNIILTVLEKNPTIRLHEEEAGQTSEEVDEEGEISETKQVSGSLLAFIQRVDDEFLKSLQAIDPHTQDYVQRLQDENILLELAERAQNYYSKAGNVKAAARIASRRVEHIYYKSENSDKTAVAAVNEEKEKTSGVDNKDLLDQLSHIIYAHGDERMKTRMLLCHTYYLALHDQFYEARDMMLMSHLQDNIGNVDVATQILFNRTMVQLGLCAFRNNTIKQAHSCLSEIYAGGKIKELLAQGVTNARYNEKTVEQEKLERKRQLPYHMHINLELLEAVHLICAMLLEVPNMAANLHDPRGKLISRTFRRLFEISERQVFTGPPENTREIIISAAKSLSKGDWKRCEELILGLPVWNFMSRSDQVKAMVRGRIQEEGLRTYLFTYSGYYESMSLEMLSLLFELPKNTVHSIVSKMMISEELHASWDQPSGAIVMHRAEPTRLQFLAMQFADKAATFVENNERLLDAGRSNTSYNKHGDSNKQQGQRGDKRGDGKNQDRNKTNSGNRDNKGWQQRDNKPKSGSNYTPRQRTQAAH